MARAYSKSFTPAEIEQIIDAVCFQLAEGRSLSRILREDENMPSYPSFDKWLMEDPERIEKVARAREAGSTKLIEETIDIADEATSDVYIEYTDSGPRAKIDGDTIQRAKLRIETRQKYAAMIAPRKYGAKVDLTSGGKALPAAAPTPALSDPRIQSLLALAAQRMAQGIKPPDDDDYDGGETIEGLLT